MQNTAKSCWQQRGNAGEDRKGIEGKRDGRAEKLGAGNPERNGRPAKGTRRLGLG